MYKVQIERKALKSIDKIPPLYSQKIKKAILDLAGDPRPDGCKKLKGRDAYRVRVSDYRIIYEIIDEVLFVQVIAVGHRKDIY